MLKSYSQYCGGQSARCHAPLPHRLIPPPIKRARILVGCVVAIVTSVKFYRKKICGCRTCGCDICGYDICGYAPCRNIPVSRHPPITTGENWDDKPHWSADGKTLYFISQRDGYRCIWYQRLDPDEAHARRTAAPVSLPSHSPLHGQPGIAGIELDAADNELFFLLGELTGNIWMAQAPRVP